MLGLNETIQYPKSTKCNMRPCETPGCQENCTYAYSCHEHRMGRSPAVFWPAIGLGIIAVMAIFV